MGTPGSTAPGARIVPPAMRNAWTHRSGTNAISWDNLAKRGATYQTAMRAYATRLSVNWIPNSTIGSMVLLHLTAHAATRNRDGRVRLMQGYGSREAAFRPS